MHSHKRKIAVIAAVVAALTVPMYAVAANLHNGQGSTCGPDSVGTFHFVNNQTGGAAAGTLSAIFSDGTQVTGPSKVLSNTQHFIVESNGTLIDASTDLPGRLVLSDFSCTPVKKK